MCTDEFTYPADCNSHDCIYHMNWNVDLTKREVQFNVTVRTHAVLYPWASVGFSNDGLMYKSDIVVGAVLFNGTPVTIDGNAMEGYSFKEDQVKNIYNDAVSYVNDNNVSTVWISFKRQFETGDDRDIAFDHCIKLLYPVNPGPVSMKDGKVLKHKTTPIVAENFTCFSQCVQQRDLIRKSPSPSGIQQGKGYRLEMSMYLFHICMLYGCWKVYGKFADQ